MTPNAFANFLEHAVLEQANPVQSYDINHQKVWLKKASKRHSTWIYLPLRWFSKMLGLNMLAPVPNYGGEKAIACEISRIQQLNKLNINVPEILAYNEQSVLLKDASINGQPVVQLEKALSKQKNLEDKLNLLQNSIFALDNIHSKNSYLSEAFARNILVDTEQNFSFIDFETDPGQYLSLTDCQTRDWLCFIFSTSHKFEVEDLHLVANIFERILEKNVKTFQDICRVGRKLKWILALKPEALGNDGVRMKKCIYLLKLLNDKEPLPMI
jgi:tRNA A-37 threonylcarbamoyl transferase component Bud32